MKIRIKFRKYGVMKFIGHLDMMRYFQKAMRRAKIDIAYSEGYSPHQIMSFAAPLGVGITSDGEYLDIEVRSTASSKQAVAALNEAMVDGVEIISFRELPEQAKTAMAIVAAADYKIFYKKRESVPLTFEELKVKVKAFYEDADSIIVIKKTKKSEKEMDLKQLVYDFQVLNEDGQPYFYMMLSTGSTDNVKPELLLSAFYDFLAIPFDEMQLQIHREDVYARTDAGELIALEDMGADILG